ncbi:MAG: amidinotransferase [Bacteroidia bacterium]|nr:amidinotransferase [Bacteroidia bacterium]
MMIPCASAVLMIRPACFGFNAETAESNAFQQKVEGDIQQKAVEEFNASVDLLLSHGLQVIIADDSEKPLPDSAFPNNWFSTHHDGTVIIYPMLSEIRRKEKRMDVFRKILPDAGFQISNFHDLSYFETENKFLEGTGSMVMDHQNKMIYACRSSRTFEEPLKKVSLLLRYDYLLFDARLDGKEIYHTNVLMAIGNRFAVICPEVLDEQYRTEVMDRLSSSRELLVISVKQLKNMAGNMLMTFNKSREQLCILSQTAFDSLLPEQIRLIEKSAMPVICNIPTIEKTGGGSIRCMLAEIFLPHAPLTGTC